jgi:hypothetical protein
MIGNWRLGRTRLWVLAALAVGVTLFASTPAWAAPKVCRPCPIELANVGDEPRASGEATLTEVLLVGSVSHSSWSWTNCYTGRLSVKCAKLTPGATYCIVTPRWGSLFPPIPVATVTADAAGKVQFSGDVYFEIDQFYSWDGLETGSYVVEVDRLNSDGSSTTVLSGHFDPWYWERL